MTTWLIDFINGNDANSGQSAWANAKKRFSALSSLAAGDTVKVAKTPDSDDYSLTATFTASKGNAYATASAALGCKTVLMNFSAGAGSWTAANSATVTTSNTTGSSVPDSSGAPTRNAGQVTLPASPAANTKYAYIQINTVDLSSYSELAVYVSLGNSTAAWADDMMVLKLCSDTTGDTAVDTFPIKLTMGKNGTSPTGAWVHLTRNGGGTFGASIQSIALYSGGSTPVASGVFRIATPTARTSSAQLREGDWVRDTNNTYINKVVLIENGDQSTPTVYFEGGSNQNAQVWKPLSGASMVRIRPYLVPWSEHVSIAGSTASPFSFPGSGGSSGSRISISCGWTTGTDTQDSRTFFDGSGWSNFRCLVALDGYTQNSLSYFDFTRLWLGSWWNDPFYKMGTGTGVSATDHTWTNCGILNFSNGMVANSRASYTIRCTSTYIAIGYEGGNNRLLDLGYTSCNLIGYTWNGGAGVANSGTIFYTSCLLTNHNLKYTPTTYGGTAGLTVSFTGTTQQCGALATDAAANYISYRVTLNFTTSPVNQTKLTLIGPCTVNGMSLTDSDSTYGPVLSCTSYASGDFGSFCELNNCTINSLDDSITMTWVKAKVLTLNLNNSALAATQTFTSCWLEDATIDCPNDTTPPTINFAGKWCRVYKTTFNRCNQITTDPLSYGFYDESPYKFVDCAATNSYASTSFQHQHGQLWVHCLADKPGTFTTLSGTQSTFSEAECYRFYNYQRTVGDHRIVFTSGYWGVETSTLHTAGGKGWKLNITSTSYGCLNEDAFVFRLGRVALKANKQLTASVWVNCGSNVKLVFKSRRDQFEFSGTQAEKRSVSTLTDTWEKLQWTYTPTVDGVMEVYATFIASGTGNAYLDDLNFTQV